MAMRLKKNQRAIELRGARRLQRRFDLHRMMAVVVNHRDAVDDALHVKATANTGKFRHAFANQVARNVEVERDRGSGGYVAHVMDARRMRKLEDAEVVAFVGKAEFASETFELDVTDNEVGLGRRAVGDDGG